MAPAEPGRGAEHAAESGLRWGLRLWPQHHRSPSAAGRAAVHRAGAHCAGGLDRLSARAVARLYQRGAVREEQAADGGQPVPVPEHGRGARRPSLTGRAGGLRTVHCQDDGALPAGSGREAVRGLCVRPGEKRLRRRPVPAGSRPVRRRIRHRAAAGRAGPRPRWRSPWPRPSRPGPAARRSTGSGGSAWNAPISPPTGPGANTNWPSPRTAWSSGSWKRTGRPHWPSGSA